MHNTSRNNSTKKKLVAVAAGVLAFAGMSTFASSAFANNSNSANSTAPQIRLASLDNDVVVASGRNYTANTDVSITADSSSLAGTGTIRVDGEGRFLVAFKLPGGFNERMKVSSANPAASASIRVRVFNTDVTTNTTTPNGAPQIDSRLASLDNNLVVAQTAFNTAVGEANGKITAMNAAIRGANATQQQSVVNDINVLNGKLAALNTATKNDDATIVALNNKVAKAANATELQALVPEVQKLTASIQARTAAAKELSVLADQVTAKVKA